MFVEDEPSTTPATAHSTQNPEKACRLHLKVVPGSRRTQIAGLLGDRLKVKVASPPEDGRANQAVCDLLAGALGACTITILKGATSPEKTLRIRGLSAAEVKAKLLPIP